MPSLIKYLATLGYGTRRDVTALVRHRHVTRTDGTLLRDDDAWRHDDVRVHGTPLDPPPGTLLMLHKPTGVTCSAQDVPPLVYDLLPPRFRLRRPIIAPIGRLDRDTSGLLLLTDDGPLNHRLASPRRHLPRTYRVTLAHDVHGDEGATFAAGTLLLRGETVPLAPATLHVIDPRTVDLTIVEGRYHQVRRMFAAVANHVVTLHRGSIGPLTLGDLLPSAWRIVTDAERVALTG